MATTTIRIDDTLKQQASALYESMGMSLSTAINVFLRQSVKEQRMPFQPSAGPTLPQPGTTMPNGVTYQGLDDRGYPMLDIPQRYGLTPKRDEDGTPVLPQTWKD